MEDPRIDPTELRSVEFPTAFRGYEPRFVHQFLESIAARVEAINRLIDDLEAGREPSVHRGRSSAITVLPTDELDEPRATPVVEEPPPRIAETPPLASLDDDELATLVGEETAHVLATAPHCSSDEARRPVDRYYCRIL